jgi:hypothetical protein
MHKPDQSEALREILRQTQLSGASRRALLLHTDRLPALLAKPHHLRLARESLFSLEGADRAQVFELARGRCAVVWRARGESEIGEVLRSLENLIADQPSDQGPKLGELVTTYDLPQQAGWLLDELDEEPPPKPAQPARPMTVQLLAGIEEALARADLSQFARWRTVMRITLAAQPNARLPRIETEPAWDERYFAVHALGDSLCPDYGLKVEPWLFRRLSRMLDRRMLAMLASPKDMHSLGTFAIGMNVPAILGADFQRFDDALPATQRGEVVLCLQPADMLSDPAAFLFARNFVHSRGYRLALVGASLDQLRVLDLAAAGFHYIHAPLTPDVMADARLLTSLRPPDTELVVTGLDRANDVRWAAMRGITLGRGRALARVSAVTAS